MALLAFWTPLYWSWVCFEIGLAIVTRTRRGEGHVQDRGSQLILWIAIVASITACEFVQRGMPPDLPGASRWMPAASLILLLAGLTIRCVAVLTLGKAFSVNVAIRDSQLFQRRGIYGILRHPSYSGLLLIFAAIGLHSGSWLGLAVALLPNFLALLYRIRVEEAALIRAFGEKYVEYSRVTKRLIPGIY